MATQKNDFFTAMNEIDQWKEDTFRLTISGNERSHYEMRCKFYDGKIFTYRSDDAVVRLNKEMDIELKDELLALQIRFSLIKFRIRSCEIYDNSVVGKEICFSYTIKKDKKGNLKPDVKSNIPWDPDKIMFYMKKYNLNQVKFKKSQNSYTKNQKNNGTELEEMPKRRKPSNNAHPDVQSKISSLTEKFTKNGIK